MKQKIAATISAIAIAVMGTASHAEEVVLRAISAWPLDNANGAGFRTYMDMVNEAGEGVVQIEFVGGPEVAPASEQGTMVANGIVDLLYTAPIYFAGRFPEAEIFSGKLLPTPEVRAKGGAEIFDKALRERMNATFMAFADGSMGMYVFTKNKPGVRQDGLPDLTGMKLRGTTTYQNFIVSLGGSLAVLPVAETYTALERGMVDGVGYDFGGPKSFGWGDHLNYVITPRMYGGSTVVMGNARRIDSLSDEAKEILARVAIEYEAAMDEEIKTRETAQLEELKANGMEVITLDGEARDTWQKLAVSAFYDWLRDRKYSIDMEEALAVFAGYSAKP